MCIKVINEIVNTSFQMISNEPVDDFPLEFPPMRRTHTMICTYCWNRWSSVQYEGTTNLRVCSQCKYSIKHSIYQKRINMYRALETVEKKKLVHEQIIDIGMHPCRVRQTQLAENLHLFRKPSN